MSSTDSRTVDPAMPHHSENGGHEMSDFSWTTVMWLLPISALTLIGFTLLCLFWFKGAKDAEIAEKQAMLTTQELNILHAKEDEVLSSYKWLDKDKGRVQIPISRAMELVVQEHQNVPGRDWKPITDTYLEGAAVAIEAAAPVKSAPAAEEKAAAKSIEKAHKPAAKAAAKAPAANGISIEPVPEPKAKTAEPKKAH